MESTPLWTILPSVAALVIGLVLFLSSRLHTWSDPEIPPDDKRLETDKALPITGGFSTRLDRFIVKYKWEILLVGVLAFVLLYAYLSAPVQLTGEISAVPNFPGRPFYFLHWIRNHLRLFYHETASISNLLTGLASLSLILVAILQRSPAKLRAGILWGLISLAGSAQWMISSEQLNAGIYLYLIAGAGFFFWMRFIGKGADEYLQQSNAISPRWEAAIVLATIALAAFARLYVLDSIPYGIEGDEAKWTAEVVSLGIRGEPDANSMYHRDALPVSFYMQTLFHRLLGPSLYAARFEVAFFSIVGTFIFYLFLRQITAMPIAMLAAWFLSASVFDISASRLANVESHVKIWILLTLALLIWATRQKRWQAYAITGIVLAIGMLTYDTVWPLGLMALLLTIMEARLQKDRLASVVQNIIALLLPSILAAPLLIPYITGRMSYYEFGEKGFNTNILNVWVYFTEVLQGWYVTTYQDFLYNRNGPLLNAFLLPWMTLGFFTLVMSPRQRLSRWTLMWVLLFIFPVPILAHSPFGRVYYPALPAMYVLVAVGGYLVGRESVRALGGTFHPLVTTAALVILFWIPVFNLYMYFNEVVDGEDRQMRREVAELVAEVANPDALVILASVPENNEPLNNEYQMIELFMLEKFPTEQVDGLYKNISLEEVLPAIHELTEPTLISVVLDKVSESNRQERDALAQALRQCYPQASWTESVRFDRVDINREARASSACISTVLSLEYTSENTFSWELQNGNTRDIALKCEVQQIPHNWVEAELLPAASGWQTETAFATDWAGNGFLMDNYGSQPVQYNFNAETDAPIFVWVRFYKRAFDNSPAQLTINEKTFSFTEIDDEQINQWVWKKIGPFDAKTGSNTMVLERPYVDDPTQFMAIFIDSIAITADLNFSPSDASYLPLRSHQFHLGQPQTQGLLTLELDPGTYRCRAEINAATLVDAFGNTPVTSNVVNFLLSP